MQCRGAAPSHSLGREVTSVGQPAARTTSRNRMMLGDRRGTATSVRGAALFVAAFVWVGAGLGAYATLRASEVNPSIDAPRDLLVIGGCLAAIYGAMVGTLGCLVLAAAAITSARRRTRASMALGFGAGHVAVLAGTIAFALGYLATAGLEQGMARSALRGAMAVVALACALLAARSSLARIHGKKVALAYAVLFSLGVCVLAAGTVSGGYGHPETSVVPAVQLSSSAQDSPRAASGNAKARVFLIGIDGMDWRRIEPLRARGRLPNIDRLIRRGARSSMRTFVPSWSPILWTTVATGTSADVHGVLDFTETPIPGLHCGVQRLRKSRLLPEFAGMRRVVDALFARGLLQEVPITACQRHTEALWNILSWQQERVAVVNWFATWPAEPVNGYLISDRNPRREAFFAYTPRHVVSVDRKISYPEDLIRTLGSLRLPEVGSTVDEILSLPFFAELHADEREKLAADPKSVLMFGHIYQSDEFASAAALNLLESERVAFLALYMSGIDNTSHPFGTNTGVVDRYYELMDEKVGAIVAHADDDTSILLLSDHGWEYEDPQRFGHEHAPEGVLIAAGPGIARGVTLSHVPRLHDVAPTVLALLGYPKSRAMVGEVIPEIATAAATGARLAGSDLRYVPPTVRGADQGSPNADETMEKLRALGYVE